MQDEPNRKAERRQQPAGSVDGAPEVENSIRRAFLVHMGEQQRQYPIAATRRPPERGEVKKR